MNITRKIKLLQIWAEGQAKRREKGAQRETHGHRREREREREREGKIETRRNGKKPQDPTLSLIAIPFVLKSNSPQNKKLAVPPKKRKKE